MSTEYTGLPTVAREYWRNYTKVSIGLGIAYTFLAGFAGVITLTIIPEAVWLIAIATVSFVLHAAAMYMRDVRKGRYDPSQMTYSSRKQLIAHIILLGSIESAILLTATFGGFFLYIGLGIPLVLAVAFAAYYPVAELILMRRGKYSIGYLVAYCVAWIIQMAVNIHRSSFDDLPVIGRQKRPQS